jgi:DNA gyrase subunit A
MARDWPARDVAPLIALIDDPRHKINADGTFGCRTSRPAPSWR